MDVNPAEYVRLRNEYHVTLRVLAVVAERLLESGNLDMLVLSDEEVLNAPDLEAYRDDLHCQIGLRVTR